MFSDGFGKAKGTQEVTAVTIQCIQSGASGEKLCKSEMFYDSDEEEDLIVDLSTGSLKPMRLKNYLLMNEVMEDLQRL